MKFFLYQILCFLLFIFINCNPPQNGKFCDISDPEKYVREALISRETSNQEFYCNLRIRDRANPVSTSTPSGTTTVTTPIPSFKIGGTITGTISGNLVLRINNTETITVTSLGSFISVTSYPTGTTFTLTVDIPNSVPNKCAITNGTGTVANSDISNVAINCRSFKFLFPTTNTYNGNLGGITGADNFCNGDAARPDTTSSYKALIAQVGVRRDS